MPRATAARTIEPVLGPRRCPRRAAADFRRAARARKIDRARFAGRASAWLRLPRGRRPLRQRRRSPWDASASCWRRCARIHRRPRRARGANGARTRSSSPRSRNRIRQGAPAPSAEKAARSWRAALRGDGFVAGLELQIDLQNRAGVPAIRTAQDAHVVELHEELTEAFRRLAAGAGTVTSFGVPHLSRRLLACV